ncbi:hypothetical protein C0J45_20805 [Silurus meridionalis]|nr:hypothetical protein C0J45_20805 [Silurus meridionalis]
MHQIKYADHKREIHTGSVEAQVTNDRQQGTGGNWATGDEEVMGRYGFKERNVEGQMVVDFAKRMEMAVVNTYYKKKEDHRVIKSGRSCTQVDYVLCRRCNLKEIGDCKVLAGDSVARQHRMVVCRMVLEEEDCSERFRKEVRQGLGGGKKVLDDWATTAEVIRETARKLLGVTSGNRKEDKETWWWNEVVQESIRRKRLAKQNWDRQSDEKSRQEYKEMRQQVKRDVATAKEKAYEQLYEKLDTKEGEKDFYRLARKNVLQVRAIKGGDGNVLTSEESVLRKWREYFEQLMNEENEREREEGRAPQTKGQKELHCVLVDLEKAYDRVPREELWYCIRKSGVSEKYVRVVQDMYEDSVTAVKCAVGTTDWFKVEVGLHQGLALSPFLFAVVMDRLTDKVRQEPSWTMMFADYIVICGSLKQNPLLKPVSKKVLEKALGKWFTNARDREGNRALRAQRDHDRRAVQPEVCAAEESA